MNADEAWDDYVRTNSFTKGNASLQGQLNTMQAQMNELSTAVQLLSQVANKVLGQQGEAESAAAPAPAPGADPMAAMAGGAPVDPAMAGGAPPMGADPMAAMTGGAPPMAGGADPAMAGGAPPMAPPAGGEVPPGAEGMAPPTDGMAPPAEETPVDIGDDDLMSALSGADLGGMEDEGEGGDMAEEEPAPEEAPAGEPAPEEAPAEGGPEVGIQPTDVHAAYEAFIEALKNLAHIAVDDSRLYLVDEIANGINAISATFGSKICPILDEMSMSADNEGETEGGPDNLFSKSYNIYKSAPLVKGMSRKQAVETFMKSGWTAPIKKDEVSEGAAPPATEGEPAPAEGAADAANLGNQNVENTEAVAASASPCQEEIEKSGCEETESDCAGEVAKSEKSEYQSFRDLMKARAGEHTGTRTDFDTYQIEKKLRAFETNPRPGESEEKVKQIQDREDARNARTEGKSRKELLGGAVNFRGDHGLSYQDALDKLTHNPDLNYDEKIKDVDTAMNGLTDETQVPLAENAINALDDKAALPLDLMDRSMTEGEDPRELSTPSKNPKASTYQNRLDTDERMGSDITDAYRSLVSQLLNPAVLKNPDLMTRVYSTLLDHSDELRGILSEKKDDLMLNNAQMPTE